MFILLKRQFWKAPEVPAENWLSGATLAHQRNRLKSGAPLSSLFLTKPLLEQRSLHCFIVAKMPGPGLYKYGERYRAECMQSISSWSALAPQWQDES